MKSRCVALFGEAEKGEFGIPLICQSLPQLCDVLGNPPEESQGIFYAVQTLLYSKQVLFCLGSRNVDQLEIRKVV